MSIGILPRITNAECDFHGLGHRHEAASTGCHGKWDKLIGFAAALAIHSLLFLGVWRHEKIHSPPPSSAMTVSIVYLGPSSKGKAAEAGAPRAVSATPAKQKPTRTEAHVSAKPMVGPAQKSSSAVEAVPAVKAAPAGREGGPLIPGNIVNSTAYNGATNRDVGLALRHEGHLLQVNVSRQTVGFEGFSNQRMDMTSNRNTLINLRYTGLYQWGDLEARAYIQDTRHKMDMGPDRYFYGTGMPMDTKGETRGAQLQGNITVSERDILRVGAEYQNYILYDWWPPVGGSMGPNAFWNVDYGQRDKIDAFVEWEARWNAKWVSQMGVRGDAVRTNAGPVEGYDNGLAGIWGNDAAAFNALDRERTDVNWDLTALTRYAPSDKQVYEAGYARKSHSPNLYQRYPWATAVRAITSATSCH